MSSSKDKKPDVKPPENVYQSMEPLNQMLQGLNDWMDKNRQEAIERHKEHTADPASKRKLVEEYLKRDTWLLFGEAFPLACGADPKDWEVVKLNFNTGEKRLAVLAKSDAGVSLKVIGQSERPPKWRVKPADFISWLSSKAPQYLANLGFKKPADAKRVGKSPHGNSEVHAKKREQVLAAALALVAFFPEKCKQNGKFSGTAIARLMEQKAPLWFGDQDIPLSPRSTAELINKALRVFDSD